MAHGDSHAGRRRLSPRAAVAATVLGGMFALGASVVTALVAALLSGAFDGGTQDQALSSLPVLAASVGATSLVLLATALIAPATERLRLAEALGLRGAPAAAFVAAPIGVVALGPVSDLLMRLMARVAPDLTFGGLEVLRTLALEHPPWLLFPIVALLPGIAEELFFRGMLQRAFGFGVRAVLISAVAFALFHVDPHHAAGVLPLGLYLAWLGAITRSTWVPAVAHVLNNTVALLAPRVAPLDVGYGTERPMPAWWTFTGVVIALAAGLVVYASVRTKRGATPINR